MLYGTSAQALTSLGVSTVCDLVYRINTDSTRVADVSVCVCLVHLDSLDYYNSCTEVIINTVTSDLQPNNSEYERIMSDICMFMICTMYNRLPKILLKRLVLGFGITCLKEK